MADTNAVLIQIRGDVADINAKLADLKGHIGKVSEATKKMGAESKNSWQMVAAGWASLVFLAGQVRAQVGGMVNTVLDLANAYGVQESAESRLRFALAAHGVKNREVTKIYAEYASQLQQTTIYSDDAILSAMQLLTTMGTAPSQIRPATEAVLSLSYAYGLELPQAAKMVGQAMEGNFRAMGRLIPALKGVESGAYSAADVLKIIQQYTGNIAAGEVTTYTGKLKQMTNAWMDLKEMVGGYVVPTLKTLIDMTMNGIHAIEGLLGVSSTAWKKKEVELLNKQIESMKSGGDLGTFGLEGLVDNSGKIAELTAKRDALEKSILATQKEQEKTLDEANKDYKKPPKPGEKDAGKANRAAELEALRETNRARIQEMQNQAKAEEELQKFNGASALKIEEENYKARLNIAWEKYYNELIEIQKEADIKARDTKGFDRGAFVSQKEDAAGNKFAAEYNALLADRDLLDKKGAEQRRLMKSAEIRYDRQVAQEAIAQARTKEGTITAISAEAWEERARYHRLTGEEIAETDAEMIRVMIDEYENTLVGGVKSALQEISDEAANVGKKTKEAVKGIFDDLSDTLTDFLVDGTNNFESFATSAIKQLIKIQLQAIMTGQSMSFLGTSSGGSLDSVLGNLLIGNSFTFEKHGDAFESGRITKFAKGTVVFNPTLFPMANGMGLMGEAGPEAVMPLARLPNGDLGVKSADEGGNMYVNIINNAAGVEVTERRRETPRGMEIDVMIDAAVGKKLSTFGTQSNKALRSNFGARETLVQR